MNIAIVLSQPFDSDGGGVQRSTSKLALIYRENGHQVIIISLNPSNKVDFFSGIPVRTCIHENELKSTLENANSDIIINQAGYSLRITKQLLKVIEGKKIINTLRINPLNFYDNHQSLVNDIFDKKGLSFLKIKIIYKLILAYHVLKQRLELGYIIQNVDAFVMLSERFKEELYQLVPAVKKYDDKIFGINNPFPKAKCDVSKLQKQNVILHVGRLSKGQKRVDLLIQIWKKLHVKLQDWEFWVVGYGPEEENMKSFCIENNMNRVKFFGKQNPEEYYRKSKIFHLTSAFEGFGNVLIEAQSYGCIPMLFDSYSAASEIVNHDKDGVLIEPFNIDKYAEMTLKLIEDEKKLESMRNSSVENTVRFSYENTFVKWEHVFDSIKD